MTMLEHHIQKTIVDTLTQSESGARFADLKPEGIENKLFDYHLKILIRDSLVVKNEDGLYALTPEGRRMWRRTTENRRWFAEAAYSVVFCVVRRKSDNAWLLAHRKRHPLINKAGFIHTVPRVDMELSDSVPKDIQGKTGLTGTFQHLGEGYLRMFKDGELESFTHFSLMVCEDAEGELVTEDADALYSWEAQPNFDDPVMVPNMRHLADLYEQGQPFFTEKTIQS